MLPDPKRLHVWAHKHAKKAKTTKKTTPCKKIAKVIKPKFHLYRYKIELPYNH